MSGKVKRYLILFLTIAAILFIFFLVLNDQMMGHIKVHLNGNQEMSIEYESEFTDPGAKAYINGKASDSPVAVHGKVNTDKLGTYYLTYSAWQLIDHDSVQRTVSVVDTTAPVIILMSDPEYYTLPGEEYQEEGFVAVDNYDGDITDQVIREEADGVISYTVVDSSGNRATVTREIPYNDPIAPKLSLLGEQDIKIVAGSEYEDPGFTALDNCDGDITDSVKIDGEVNIYSADTYTLKYTATDSYGNTATATRTVTVEPIVQPDTVTPEGKIIYLTFDDGPGPYTKDLLEILDKYNVKATFFTVNGKYNDLIKKEYEAGHSIGIHSATHDYETIYASEEAFFQDLQEQQKIIQEQTGEKTTLIRFPGGSSNTISRHYCEGIMTQLVQDVTDLGYQYFDWNVTSGDAGETTDTEEIYENVIKGCSSQDVSIVLQHDIKAYSVAAVEKIIIWGLKNGYTFLPLEVTSPGAHHGTNN